jgi:hypothetical protein
MFNTAGFCDSDLTQTDRKESVKVTHSAAGLSMVCG